MSKTSSDSLLRLPKKKNMRVDYIKGWSFLVDYTDGNDCVIYYEYDIYPLSYMYAEFKFAALQKLPITAATWQPIPYPFKIIPGLCYVNEYGIPIINS
jgi:hypothetical protein